MRKLSIEQLRLLQIQILDEVVSFCNQHNIRYFLMGGTLIGAVRHQGYIPWDDDIDICMMRDDYEKFIQLYTQQKNTDYYVYSQHVDKNCSFFFTKFCLKNTLIVEKNLRTGEKIGINIDIFPVDVMPFEQRYQISDRCTKWLKLRNMKAVNVQSYWDKSKIKGSIVFFAKLCITPFLSYQMMSNKVNDIAKNATINYTGAMSAGNLVWGYGRREIVDATVFDEAVYVPFEGKQYTAPKGYDTWLTTIYGDYMALPPIEQRRTHETTAFILNESD